MSFIVHFSFIRQTFGASPCSDELRTAQTSQKYLYRSALSVKYAREMERRQQTRFMTMLFCKKFAASHIRGKVWQKVRN
jgi:hypothetical protein